MSEMKDLVGKVILFGVHTEREEGNVYEGQVVELTPSGRFARMDLGDAGGRVVPVDKLNVLEVLPTDDEAKAAAKAERKAASDQAKADAAAEKEREKQEKQRLKEERLAAAGGVTERGSE